jgi:hypothetical protein
VDLASSVEDLEAGKHVQESLTLLVVSVHAALVMIVVVALAGNELMLVVEVVHFPCCLAVAALLESGFAAFDEERLANFANLQHPSYFPPLTLLDLPEKMGQKMGY